MIYVIACYDEKLDYVYNCKFAYNNYEDALECIKNRNPTATLIPGPVFGSYYDEQNKIKYTITQVYGGNK